MKNSTSFFAQLIVAATTHVVFSKKKFREKCFRKISHRFRSFLLKSFPRKKFSEIRTTIFAFFCGSFRSLKTLVYLLLLDFLLDFCQFYLIFSDEAEDKEEGKEGEKVDGGGGELNNATEASKGNQTVCLHFVSN